MFNDMASIRLNYKFPSSDNAVHRTKATLKSGGGDLLSYPNGNDIVIDKDLVGDESVGIEALAADTGLTNNVFSLDNDEFDLDSPTEGFASIPEAIEDIRQGKVATLSLSLSNIISFFFFSISLLAKEMCIM